MGRDPWSTVRRPIRPFLNKSNEAKRGKPSSPKPQLDPPEPILAINFMDTKMAIEPVGPKFGHGAPWTIFPTMASGNHQRPPNQLRVMHIWYYIPLCTIFAPKFNGDVFRTKLDNFKSRSQNPPPISKEDSLTHQSRNPWRKSEDHSTIPITFPSRSWVGNFVQDHYKGMLRGNTIVQEVFKASSISTLLGQLNCSMKASINQPVCPWPNWANSICHCVNSITQFNFKMGRTVLAHFRQYSR
ncbi:hypothetical protein O181_092741 [Austropuccinia psidii MF-1]|uniref:Uncharacterized protein n=1 Tax=Austropuccinia psidii MF-1 TaxID=1389203 RepID=A0A9Q3PAX0_9BASI|nr:hypothetical protein [Austropuccinia psidii MF-1]